MSGPDFCARKRFRYPGKRKARTREFQRCKGQCSFKSRPDIANTGQSRKDHSSLHLPQEYIRRIRDHWQLAAQIRLIERLKAIACKNRNQCLFSDFSKFQELRPKYLRRANHVMNEGDIGPARHDLGQAVIPIG